MRSRRILGFVAGLLALIEQARADGLSMHLPCPDGAKANPTKQAQIGFWSKWSAYDSDGLVCVLKKPELKGRHIKSVSAIEESGQGTFLVLAFDEEGARKVREVTDRRFRERVVLVLDGRVLVMPTIVQPISDGRIQFGPFPQREAQRFVRRIEQTSLVNK